MADDSKKPRQSVSVVAIGRVSKEPETKGKLTFTSLASNQRVREDGEWKDGPTMWFDIKTAGPQLLGASKGDLVQVEGRLAMREYQGKNYYTIWVEKLTNFNDENDFPVAD